MTEWQRLTMLVCLGIMTALAVIGVLSYWSERLQQDWHVKFGMMTHLHDQMVKQLEALEAATYRLSNTSGSLTEHLDTLQMRLSWTIDHRMDRLEEQRTTEGFTIQMLRRLREVEAQMQALQETP